MLNSGFILKQNYVVLLAESPFVLALGKVTPLQLTKFAGQILDWRKKERNSFSACSQTEQLLYVFVYKNWKNIFAQRLRIDKQ